MKFLPFSFNLVLKREKLCFSVVFGLSTLMAILSPNYTFAQTSQWTTCEGDGCKGTNLVTNGGFEDQIPNSGTISPDISTDFGMIICPPDEPSDLWGKVLITQNPLLCYPFWDITDHTFGNGTGNMMIIDFPDTNPFGGFGFIDIWSKTISVDSGKIYCFGAWFKNLNSDTTLSKPNFRYLVDNTLIGISQELPYDSTNKWTFYGFVYDAQSTGPVTITIRNGKWGGEGNDLAMDDVEFREIGNGSIPPVTLNDDGGTLNVGAFKTFYVTNNDTLNYNAPASDSNISIFSVHPTNMGTAAVDISGNITFNSNGQIGQVTIVYEYCQPTGCCDQASLRFLVDVILPNSWLQEFSGNEVRGGINLEWESTDEPNQITYELKRSFDQKQFTKVARIDQLPGKGDKSYRYLDTDLPFNGAGYVYYKLSATDVAGNRYESSTIQVRIGSSKKEGLMFEVFPNPANGDMLNILFKDPVVRKTEITIFNMNGQVFKRVDVVGRNRLTMNIRELPAGFYLIAASDGRLKEILKFQVYD